ncbi:septum site-determining protein MinC [Deinococcus peraridilitoris]|uniref:Septum formation inhibitor n=1 Tax=Deinococcus peraridilitoris (strain DSM 19664 / LMG 22246 / CIP 109416 / KR-200) TaxID=937777 RepID=L0A5S0_DEIPD|nr:septum site-determining protein MinC [Deinococcus peraridilitoris]AFZ68789.1 septum formation inhibitor [Deinococcus peraridilitoris DSM 19664]
MKLRGTLGGLNLLIEAGDSAQSIEAALLGKRELLAEHVTVELEGEVDVAAVEAALNVVRAAGGEIHRLRAGRLPTPESDASARTVIVPHSVRAGFRGEYKGSVVILGDVNPGAAVIAGGDVIVMGALRGVVHAGAGGKQDAIVWARPIASPQIRLGDAMARAPEDNALASMRRIEEGHAEIARLHEGAIVIESHSVRS